MEAIKTVNQPQKQTMILTKIEAAGITAVWQAVKRIQDQLAVASKEAMELAAEVVAAHKAPPIKLQTSVEVRPGEGGRLLMIYEAAPVPEPIPVSSANVIPMNGAVAAPVGG